MCLLLLHLFLTLTLNVLCVVVVLPVCPPPSRLPPAFFALHDHCATNGKHFFMHAQPLVLIVFATSCNPELLLSFFLTPPSVAISLLPQFFNFSLWSALAQQNAKRTREKEPLWTVTNREDKTSKSRTAHTSNQRSRRGQASTAAPPPPIPSLPYTHTCSAESDKRPSSTVPPPAPLHTPKTILRCFSPSFSLSSPYCCSLCSNSRSKDRKTHR